MKKNIRGYTMVELMLVVSIIGIITAVVIINFQEVKQERALITSAEALTLKLREVQSNAQTGVSIKLCRGGTNVNKTCASDEECKGTAEPGVCKESAPRGIHFVRGSPAYSLFIDNIQNGIVRRFDNEEAVGQDELGLNITVGALRVNNQPSETLDVVFEPPKPKTWISGGEGIAEIVLQHTLRNTEKTVVIKTVLGKIEVR